MVAHIIDFSTGKAKAGRAESEISLVYTGSSRTDRAIQRYFASKKKNIQVDGYAECREKNKPMGPKGNFKVSILKLNYIYSSV